MNNQEFIIRENDILVTMTDPKGMISYANDLFLEAANYERSEVLGQAHNLVRHPDMPKTVFKILWSEVLAGRAVSAFVKNKVNGGGYYWVCAFVMPVMENGTLTRIISYRRAIDNSIKETLTPLYKVLCNYEQSHSVDDSLAFFTEYLKERGMTYQTFLNRLSTGKQISNKKALTMDVQRYYTDHIVFKSRVVASVSRGEKNIEVIDACCCNFGKFIQENSSESFTRHASWSKVISAHNDVHSQLKSYVHGHTSEDILEKITKDTVEIFDALTDVINYCN